MGWFSDATGGIFDPISEPLAKAEDTVRDELAGLDDFVNENVPGGWAGVILIAGGIYYAPEIGAYFSSTGAPLTAAEASAAEAAAPELLGEAGGNAFALEAGSEGSIALGDAGTATTAEVTAANAAMAEKGLTFQQALNYVRGGLLANSLIGDPLGLSGDMPSGGSGTQGFSIVPVPTSWKSPTYAKSQATPIRFEDLFPGQSLQGTQWQGSQNAIPNMTFNQMFSSGLQSTPMGTPVDINQIVGSILGQNATR
jgi:hypothetical protein